MAKQKQSFSYWLSQKRSTIIVAAVIILLLFWLFGFNFVKIAGLIRQKQDLNAQIKAQQEKSDQLDAEIKQIGTQAYTEYIARKNLNLYSLPQRADRGDGGEQPKRRPQHHRADPIAQPIGGGHGELGTGESGPFGRRAGHPAANQENQ